MATSLGKILRFCAETFLMLVAASVLSALLFRATPGSDVDSLEASPRLSEASKAAIHQQRSSVHALAGTSFTYYRKMLQGDFGVSEMSGRPVSQLLWERVPSTATLVFLGSSVSLILALSLAAWSTSAQSRRVDWVIAGFCSTLLAVPSGVVALLSVAFRIPVELALVAIVVPRLYAYSNKLLEELFRSDYILAAQCQGVRQARIFLYLLLPAAAPEVCGLYSLSMVTSLGVCIALEVFGTRSGVGELAWQAALNRDMPVVLAVTISVVLVVRLGMNISDLCFAAGQRHIDAKVVGNSMDSSGAPLYLRA